MPHADFVHLRVHSAYSLSEGAIKIKKLVELAKKNGMPAVAIADTGNLFGALEFSSAAVDAGELKCGHRIQALRRYGAAKDYDALRWSDYIEQVERDGRAAAAR